MTPEIQVVVHATQSWLRSSWHVQVPFAWLEACVEWLQEEAGGAARLSQQQINQQALDQWLLTDLRDLDHPVLPGRLAQAQKTELSGTFCVQVDSLMDISQPAYGQLQKWRGTDCANEEVSAVTQATQRPWEARTTRMLLLQVTDGVQSLEAMEYQSIPALSSVLRPGVKLQLQGRMVCRLGVLLLGPSNIKVLGGEVEDLVDRNNQGKVLCRMLGLPEEQQQEDGEVPPAPQPGNQEVDDLELDDAELLASLEQEEVERVPVGPVGDSGYATLSEPSTQFSRSSSIRSLASAASSRREASALSRRSGLTQSNTGVSDQEHRPGNDQADSDWFEALPSDRLIRDHNMADDDFPDEDFDDLPLEELDSVVLQANTTVTEQSNSSHRSSADHDRGAAKPQTAQHQQHTLIGSGSLPGPSNSRSTTMKRDYRGCIRERATGRIETSHELQCVTNNDKSDFMDVDVDCLIINEAEAYKEVPTVGQTGGPSSTRDKTESSVPGLTLTSPPFTYLCLLEELMSGPHRHAATTEIRVKAFIVTLLGKLSTANGLWGVCATISDGTGYLDAELSNEVLTGLLGFSVAEKVALKRDPARRAELDGGMRRCQEELVDMCCVMTIVLQPEGRKAVVTKAQPINETVLQELEQRRK